MIGYILAFAGGMFVGIIASCILLAKKNLEKAQRFEDQTAANFKAVKSAYDAYVNDSGDTTDNEDNGK